jgi:hypothetical protein
MKASTQPMGCPPAPHNVGICIGQRGGICFPPKSHMSQMKVTAAMKSLSYNSNVNDISEEIDPFI